MSTEDGSFDSPKRVAINRVYTRKGDAGRTSLVGGQRVAKHALRIETYGAVDELNAFVGQARQSLSEGPTSSVDATAHLSSVLIRVQHQLFNLGSVLATLPEDLHPRQPRIRPEDVSFLEQEIDASNEALPALRSFVLPGGSRANTDLHVCRTVCRRVERLLSRLDEETSVDPDSLAYVNRLSDAFFVWSRWVLSAAALPEVLWVPNAADGQSS
ncbi:MAG: cob(I)yrinic acid a,c-diamide adenosyltransferase [Deltaproteobacteria bacterium]|nr:MAG: cob(I)yrinic acid a,c-diamide adenosyltransferase [Deltaproteobacteria bacterium]